MKNRTFATLGLLALLAAASAFGQERMTFDVPFEFSTGGRIMPAGQYTVTHLPELRAIKLECYDCEVNVRLLTYGVGSEKSSNHSGRLMFKRYGDTYFLSSVWSRRGVGEALPTSKTERETVLRASLSPTSQVVLVARR
ncbi:MAG: hypothetical protein ACLQBJ_05610 [Bryobacteraceae bacterium]